MERQRSQAGHIGGGQKFFGLSFNFKFNQLVRILRQIYFDTLGKKAGTSQLPADQTPCALALRCTATIAPRSAL